MNFKEQLKILKGKAEEEAEYEVEELMDPETKPAEEIKNMKTENVLIKCKALIRMKKLQEEEKKKKEQQNRRKSISIEGSDEIFVKRDKQNKRKSLVLGSVIKKIVHCP